MEITQIISLDSKRTKIYLDGEFAFVLYKGELKDFGIKEGQPIDSLVYRKIMDELLPKRCIKSAMNLLQKKDYTTAQLRDKLLEGYYTPEMIDGAISYVTSYHYLDDERYCRDYITYHMENRSRNRIIQDLISKGLSKDQIIPIIEELYAEGSQDIEQEQIRSLLLKKHFDPDFADFKEKQKMTAFLLRRGFSLADIKKETGI
ncbi:MAG: recombination regulator RecX [Butyrivibrio sp.]|nr:recombination regulator RecX [Butyrivibrio sp.]